MSGTKGSYDVAILGGGKAGGLLARQLRASLPPAPADAPRRAEMRYIGG